jgi:hypothetical protein
MKKSYFFILPLFAILLTGAGCDSRSTEPEVVVGNDAFLACQKDGVNSNTYPRQCVKGNVTTEEEFGGNVEAKASRIKVNTEGLMQPLEVSTITLKGEAVGSWYSEAQFPISILDKSGKEIGTGTAHADGEWMTDDMSPWTATVTFKKPAGYTLGRIVFKKDNPSGLPANDDSLIIPVTFGE